MTNLGGPREGNCTVKSFIVVADTRDEFITRDERDHGTMPWADFIDSIAVAGGTRLAYDLFDAPQPDETVRRYRVVNEGFQP
ncbi:hypothetical protein Ade02nite_20900 [Paractinoplanes deccanensis]|uniref:Uncharacterized protein n=1 Tax=Paractinoplanes deccanensis TaxID=113561 RepID=A0ABQ3Y0B9_9ACTN|nr:hypothetical protein [Actinoplanes deccanensis]GID73449.1 hypothetical protein Ade02nite_20900 [Actinoplanes deccanensis]